MIADLYPDWKNGIITQSEYHELKERFNKKLNALEEKLATLNKSSQEFQRGITEENDFVARFKKHGNIERLTRPLLTELVEEILVYEGGDIEVVFKFREPYSKAVEYIEMNKQLIDAEKSDEDKKTA